MLLTRYIHGIAFICLYGVGTAMTLASSSQLPVQATPIFQFPSDFILENTIQRQSGEILVTTSRMPGVFQIIPSSGQNQQFSTVYNFTDFTAGGGIVELETDVFVTAVGNGNPLNTSAPTKNWGLWQLDLRQYQAPIYNSSLIKVRQVASAPDADNIDGLTLINKTAGLVAGADRIDGVLRLINIPANTSSVIASGPLLSYPKPPPPNDPFGDIGVNGLKFANSTLFFTSGTNHIYGSVRINTATGKAVGSVKQIFNYTINLDDFAFSYFGNAYLTTLNAPNGGIIRRPAGTPVGVNGSSLVVSAFGTNSVILEEAKTQCTLYITLAFNATIAKAVLPGPC